MHAPSDRVCLKWVTPRQEQVGAKGAVRTPGSGRPSGSGGGGARAQWGRSWVAVLLGTRTETLCSEPGVTGVSALSPKG